MVTKCKGCNADIIWAITAKNNKRIPLDAKSDMHPVQVGVSEDGVPVVEVRRTFVAHHGTCPAVAQFRTTKVIAQGRV